jgi:hypothetical protein
MTEREVVLVRQYNYGHEKQNTSPIPLVPSFASPTPPKPTGGAAFPANAPKIFSLSQNSLTLLYNALKLQPQNFGMWRRLKRIFAMLAKEHKEVKEVLWEFLGFEDDVSDEVGICTKVLVMRNWFEEWILCFGRKSPPNEISATWMFTTILRLLRAPNRYLRVVG